MSARNESMKNETTKMRHRNKSSYTLIAILTTAVYLTDTLNLNIFKKPLKSFILQLYEMINTIRNKKSFHLSIAL